MRPSFFYKYNMNIEITLLPHQKSFIQSNSNKVLLLAGRATGKSYVASIVAAMNLLQGKRMIVLAQTFSALQRNIFQEIVNRLDEWNIEYNYNRSSMIIACCKGVVYGYSYENLDAIRGLTDISIAICDEIAYAPRPDIFLATLAPVLRGKNIIPKIYAMTTPRGGSEWNELFKNDKSWDIISATTFDNTFLSKESLDLMTNTLSEDMKQQELYGQLLDYKVENSIVDIDNVKLDTDLYDETYYYGLDFARYGIDKTVIVIRNSYKIIHIEEMSKADTDTIVETYLRLYQRFRPTMTALDATGGYDIGFYDRLKHSHPELKEVNFGAASPNNIYLNNRAYIYGRLADACEKGFAIKDTEIRRALKYTTWTLTNSGKRQLIPKEKIKEIIGHSPDTTDALALTFYDSDIETYKMDRQKAKNTINFLFR